MSEETTTGQAGTSSIDPSSPELQDIIRKAVDAEVTGLKSKNSELLGKLKEAGERMKALDALGGEDGIKQLSEMRARLEKDEDLKLFAEGKHEEYNERITRRAKADLQKQLEARDKLLSERDAALKQIQQKFEAQVIDTQVRQAASKAEMFPGAIEDALLHAGRVFSLDENGHVIARNAQGELETGKDGKALTINEWLESMREARPHWWPAASGMGAKPSSGNGMSGPKSWGEAKTIAEKKAYLLKRNPQLNEIQ